MPRWLSVARGFRPRDAKLAAGNASGGSVCRLLSVLPDFSHISNEGSMITSKIPCCWPIFGLGQVVSRWQGKQIRCLLPFLNIAQFGAGAGAPSHLTTNYR
jgi:hypothetical protein